MRGIKITSLPKLAVKPYGYGNGTIFEIEQVKGRLNYERFVVLFDGRRVRSDAELVELAGRDEYRDRDVVDLVLLSTVEGG